MSQEWPDRLLGTLRLTGGTEGGSQEGQREAHRRDSQRLSQGTWRGTGRVPSGWIALNLQVRDLKLRHQNVTRITSPGY